MNTTARVRCQFSLPEFHRDRVLEWKLHVTQDLGAYDMILGRDVLSGLGIKIDFANNLMEWDSVAIPMKEADANICEAFNLQEPARVISATDRFKGILEAKYEKADLAEVAKEAVHLTDAPQTKLHNLLKEFPSLFDGSLGKWNMGAYDIQLRPDATPYHARAYPIPKAYTETLKVEVARLVEAGVLRQVNRSEWAAPTFIIPKKDGSVRFISDFRELNKRTDQAQAVSYSENTGHAIETRRISVRYEPGLEHGILPYRVKPTLKATLYDRASMGEVRVSTIANGSL